MSEKDDDFLDHNGGDEFNPELDDHHIPEDPHHDDGFLDDSGDGFDLSADDVLDMSSDNEGGDDFFASADETVDDSIDLEQMSEGFETPGSISADQGYEYTPAQGEGQTDPHGQQLEEEAPQGDPSLGWKAWTGLALAAVLTAGGLSYMVWPESPSSNASNRQANQSLPTPPPAPPEPSSQMADSGSEASRSGVRSQGAQNAPVSVSPFPEYGDNQSTQPPAMNGEGPANPSDGALTAGNGQIEPPPPLPMGGNGDLADPNFGALPAEDEEYKVGANAPFNNDGAVPQRASFQPDGEPQYMAALDQQRQAFGVLMNLTQENRKELAGFKRQFESYKSNTDQEVSKLDSRVSELERILKDGRKVTQANKAGSEKPQTSPKTADKPSSKQTSAAKSQSEKKFLANGYAVPKTPSEIKALQRRLKNFNYRPGAVDGVLGSQTRWAIKRLQEEHGLPVTGWLSAETLQALDNPKRYSGTYSDSKQKVAKSSRNQSPRPTPKSPEQTWFVRGVTPTKAVVYRPDGLSYAVKVGTEIPGMGQVTRLDTEKLHVVTARGVITRR